MVRSLAFGTLLLFFAATAVAEDLPTEAWVHIWNGPTDHDDYGQLLALDPAGPIYVAGSSYGSGPGDSREDFFLQRLDANGNLLWTQSYGGPDYDAPSDMLMPESGRVLVTGLSYDTDHLDLLTLLYDDTGALVWERRFPLSGTVFTDYGPHLALDGDGNILVAATSNADYLVLKYSPTGSLIWSRSVDGPTGGLDFAFDVDADATGAVYVTGLAHDAVNFGGQYLTVKFDADGNWQWQQGEFGDLGSIFEYVALEVAPDGDIVVVGNPESTCGVFQLRVWKLAAASGAVQWLNIFPDDPCDTVEPVDMTLDAAGNVVVTGNGKVGTLGFHFQTVKIAPDGALLWHRSYDGVGTSSDLPAALCADGSGDVYVTGLTTFPPQNRDFATVKYAADGTEAWSMSWAGPFGTNDGGADVAVTAAGDVVVSGQLYDPDEGSNAVAVLYRQDTAAATPPAPITAGLSVAPALNPFTDRTDVAFSLTRAGSYTLTVHDLRGRRVRTLRSGSGEEGDHHVAWRGRDDNGRALPSGTYFLRLETAQGVATARAALVR